MPRRKRGFDSRTKLQSSARVAKRVKAPVCKTGNREFESHRVLLMRRWSRNQARLAHNQQIIR